LPLWLSLSLEREIDVKKFFVFAVILCTLGVSGCGGLRYSELSPDAGSCRPRQVAILPVDATAFPEARETANRLFAEVLAERQWFAGVVGGNAIAERMKTDDALRTAVSDYQTKRAKVNYSDPELSSRIGALTGADAFLTVNVDSWLYTVREETKLAKTGFSIAMVESKTGKVVWKAAHDRSSEYLLVKPDLAGLARGLIREMTDQMPH
jgi:hypothetical protein